jgi:hypothetical protein
MFAHRTAIRLCLAVTTGGRRGIIFNDFYTTGAVANCEAGYIHKHDPRVAPHRACRHNLCWTGTFTQEEKNCLIPIVCSASVYIEHDYWPFGGLRRLGDVLQFMWLVTLTTVHRKIIKLFVWFYNLISWYSVCQEWLFAWNQTVHQRFYRTPQFDLLHSPFLDAPIKSSFVRPSVLI